VKARIRDFFETKDGWIFAVADYAHPQGLRSLLRYIPDPDGEREANGRRYKKMDFDPAFEFLRRERPDYVKDLHVVPDADVNRLFLPSIALKRAAERNPRVKKIADALSSGGVPDSEDGHHRLYSRRPRWSQLGHRFRGIRPLVVEGQRDPGGRETPRRDSRSRSRYLEKDLFQT